ncbi:unnamed protein product [Caenorhabditis angaria]|uniref:Thyroglobulin type-1 domain-containing protein n=1 Tax=Caenorhabditis angaria TaxID=860376 RepID=A0A9P1N4E3_9PELO|nr:unnamed protein product [Caenorhabditis angaria]
MQSSVFIYLCFLIVKLQMQPISSSRSGLGILDISETNPTGRRRFEEVIRLDCASQRQKARLRQSSGDSKIYVPVCSTRNPLYYERVQCHEISNYCWCVDEVSGEPKIGTNTFHGKPKCPEVTTVIIETRKNKKKNRCKANRRQRFLRRLIATIKTEMILGNGTSKIGRDTAIRWKFNQLDKNNNGVLERIEWKPYKSILLEWKNARHCSRNFFKTCDLDRNRKLSSDEWVKCIVQEVNRVPAKRPDQLNPFLYILKPE